MFRVMIRDNMSPRAKEIMEQTGKIEVVVDNDKATNDPQALSELIGEFDGLAVRSGTKVRAEVLEKADCLKVIGRAGIGVDNIDVEAATRRGIFVLNVPGGNVISVAEHTFALMLALVRRVARADASLRRGEWERERFRGTELHGKTLGLAGAGRIGTEVAKRARAFGMKVIAYDPYMPHVRAEGSGIRLVGLADLMASADVVSVHTPLTEETEGLIGAAELGLMKPSAYLINTSRSLIFSTALPPSVLSSALAALDVLEENPSLVFKVQENADYMREKLRSLGYDILNSQTPILPVMIGEAALSTEFSELLLKEGVLAVALRPPTVSEGTSRIRVTVMATHTREDLVFSVGVFEKVGRRLGIV